MTLIANNSRLKRYRLAIAAMALAMTVMAVLAAYAQHLAKTAEQQFPASGAFVVIDGQRLHYQESGDANARHTLLLLHGASTSLLDYNNSLRPALERRYRVIAFDRPGHGYSERPTDAWPNPATQARLIAKALSKLHVERAHWVGHSWAGSVVLAAALNNSDQVASVTLLAGASHSWRGGVAWHTTLANTPVIGELFSHVLAAPAGHLVLKDAIADVFAPETVPENYIARTGITLSLRPQAFRNNAADLARLRDWLQGQEHRYREIQAPVLQITSDSDTLVPDKNHARKLTLALPDAQWHRLKGAGHALHHSRTDHVAKLIDQFIQSIADEVSR